MQGAAPCPFKGDMGLATKVAFFITSVGFLPGRYFCRTKGRNRGESISAIVSAISAGEKGQNLLKPDNN